MASECLRRAIFSKILGDFKVNILTQSRQTRAKIDLLGGVGPSNHAKYSLILLTFSEFPLLCPQFA